MRSTRTELSRRELEQRASRHIMGAVYTALTGLIVVILCICGADVAHAVAVAVVINVLSGMYEAVLCTWKATRP